MRIITCAGYYRSGSSAISDFFSEFDNCTSLGSTEIRMLQDPGGISDLEFNLIQNNHRHNTSHAIKNFMRLARFLNGTWYSKRYSGIWGEYFSKCTQAYVEQLTELKCKNWWHMDQIERGDLFYSIDRVYAKVISKMIFGKENTSLLKNETAYYSAISKESFYQYTKEYMEKLFTFVKKPEDEFIMVDQLVPPSNVSRYLNYFNDLKVISVERDPRDLYVLEKTKHQWGVIPYKQVEAFCSWYRITRAHLKQENDDPSSVLRIHFEDMIYRYDEMVRRLCDFVGLQPAMHVRQKEHFVPEKSRMNTKVFEKHPELRDDVSYIERTLPEYLYKFE